MSVINTCEVTGNSSISVYDEMVAKFEEPLDQKYFVCKDDYAAMIVKVRNMDDGEVIKILATVYSSRSNKFLMTKFFNSKEHKQIYDFVAQYLLDFDEMGKIAEICKDNNCYIYENSKLISSTTGAEVINFSRAYVANVQGIVVQAQNNNLEMVDLIIDDAEYVCMNKSEIDKLLGSSCRGIYKMLSGAGLIYYRVESDKLRYSYRQRTVKHSGEWFAVKKGVIKNA